MKILQVCAYGADYPGNFIKSLELLEERMKKKGYDTIYAFVEKARDKHWCKELNKNHLVYYLPEAKARIKPITYSIFKKIYDENNIDIVHCHFELYDIPAKIMAPKSTRIFLHLHDPIELKKMKWSRKILNKFQYSCFNNNVYLLSVSEYYKNQIIKLGFPEKRAFTVLNGLDIERIKPKSYGKEKYDFLTFGWDFYRKGADILFEACNKLQKEGYKFKLLFNCIESTKTQINNYFKNELPEYLVVGEPCEDVNVLFNESKVFIQASRRETFSYAVCEAAYSGMPVISSAISGLEWAKNVPSVHFFDNEDVEGLLKIMKEQLQKKGINYQSIKQSQRIIEDNYSLNSWVNNIENFYEKK